MIFQSWHTYGYGVEVTDIKCTSVERLKALIHMAPELEKKINAWFEETEIKNPTVEDYFEFDDTTYLGLASIVKGVIQEAEGLEFTACDDFENRTYLLYTQSYPWWLKPEEHALTEERIQTILVKYFLVITDETITVDYYDPENGG